MWLVAAEYRSYCEDVVRVLPPSTVACSGMAWSSGRWALGGKPDTRGRACGGGAGRAGTTVPRVGDSVRGGLAACGEMRGSCGGGGDAENRGSCGGGDDAANRGSSGGGDAAENLLFCCASCTAWTSSCGSIARSAWVGAAGRLRSGSAGARDDPGFVLGSHGFTPGGTGGTGHSAGWSPSTGVGGSERRGAGPGGGVKASGVSGERPPLAGAEARVAGRDFAGLERTLSSETEDPTGRSSRASSFMRMTMS